MTKKIEKKIEKANELTVDKLTQFEAALLQAVKAGLLKGEAVNTAILKAGFSTSNEEHAACKPISAKEQAALALAAFGIDTAQLEAETAQAGKLAVNVPDIAKALGKYGKHCFGADMANGTSIVTHSITAQLVNTGKATLAKTLDDARKYLPSYSSTGHFNTCKRLLKEHYSLNVWQGGFAISAKK